MGIGGQVSQAGAAQASGSHQMAGPLEVLTLEPHCVTAHAQTDGEGGGSGGEQRLEG